jgi:hypothetical protein
MPANGRETGESAMDNMQETQAEEIETPLPENNGSSNLHKTINGTNGHKSDKGANGHTRGRRTLTIVFSRCGQLDRDKYRLREIVEAVRDPKGRDQFVIVMESDGHRHQLSFPNDFCTVSDRLLGELQKYFNVDVAVQE